jgi:HAE1 family hydrophobic/amphiphilic exporter-1
MLSKFFIERPIFANVIAIITMLIGGVALYALPIEQYPEITPPTVRVSAVYPGANATVVANTVAAPIEQQVNGVENMLYMSSSASSDGSYSLTITFEIGTNLDDAQVLVQNRVSAATPLLPEEVQRQGITVKKQSSNFILILSLNADEEHVDQYDNLYLANYATLNIRDELSRIYGVGDVTVFGTGAYSMRIWIDPEQLKSRSLTTADVLAAVREQNVQVAAGQLGQTPAPKNQNFQYTVTTLGRLTEPDEFENIIIKTGADGRITYLKDVARVELGAQSYDQFNLQQGKPTANIGIYQLPGANALAVADAVKATMERLSKKFDEGIRYKVTLDTTKFVQASIREVYQTLIEAGVLVLIVILVFLQDWRAVLIPATTVPVTIIGAFAAMAALGFSVNMLTLFGLVLAIGIVVDDAIVIVENAAHHIEQGQPPKEATIQAMSEVLGPIIGITLVLMAVFLPSAFLGGITGQLYRQFALTIAATAVISAINAVTLKPAQCATWLRPVSHAPKNFFYRGFNRVYDWFEGIYVWIVKIMVRHVYTVMVVFLALVVVTGVWYTSVPSGFLPNEDQGYIFVAIQLPDAASQERSRAVMAKIDDIIKNTSGIDDWVTIGGLSLLDGSSASNAGTLFVTLKDWDERLPKGDDVGTILKSLSGQFAQMKEAVVFAFPPPSIRGLGVRAGFQMQIEAKGAATAEQIQNVTNKIMADARTQTGVAALNSTYRAGVPQIFVDIDREKVKSLDVPLATVFSTLQASLGSAYVNDFNKFGRTYQVRVQAEPKFRATPEDIERLEVRNNRGEMIPIGTLAKVKRSFGPQIVNRYNLYTTAAITGEPGAGFSSGDSLKIMEQLAQANLPDSMDFEWTNTAYQERKVGSEQYLIFLMAVLLVYLVLAAQYESWLIPAAVILIVPLGLLGAVAAVAIRGMDINVYTQIGIVLIIALASKNAILIVEFAREIRAKGKSIIDSAVEASRLRFRPILMTSFAFILGVVPLVIANGAGAAGRQALGTAVFGGMLASTILAVFFTPVFFVIFQGLSEWWAGKPAEKVSAEAPAIESSHP